MKDSVLSVCLLAVAVLTPSLAGVLKDEAFSCSEREFACADGACVSLDRVCDGRSDCSDGRDETMCGGALFDANSISLDRSRRQTQCRKNQWTCRDGSCISFDGQCDGVVDCADGSDETHALCRKSKCQFNWFRCTYGACVDGSAPCNGRKECADGSDELLPRCRNETGASHGAFKCNSGVKISSTALCDGVTDCADGSDETVAACGHITCPSYLFQCAYGACVDQGSDCDGKNDCADGSDEADALCNRSGGDSNQGSDGSAKPSPGGKCVLPPFPQHGTYAVPGLSRPVPGQSYPTLIVNVTCKAGRGVDGDQAVFCADGIWSGPIPECIRFCQLNPHPSVEYRCQVPEAQEGYRECKTMEPSGTIVFPECRAPNYYSPTALRVMQCIDGSWDYQASQICQPECGKVTPEGTGLIIDGRSAKRGELPWHVGVYRKTVKPYKQICGGSIVSTTLVISAAHCFWQDKALPAKNYAVAAGKLYRPWNEAHDADAQKRDLSDIKLPGLFLGAEANYQQDIALLIVTQAFEYKVYIRPVCLSFDVSFEKKQLHSGALGKVAGWGRTAENGEASPVLKVLELPYVDPNTCLAQAPPNFRGYITSDKICGGWQNGTALCQGDSGGGLVFPSEEYEARYYLRGIVSAAPRNENSCNAYALTTFTNVLSHEGFIKPHLRVIL